MARPNKEIDQKTFEGLCSIQCTKQEICDAMGVTDKTLENWCKRTYHAGFSEVFKQKRTLGHVSLRRSQFKMAQHNPTMSIWLGKQYLGQKDEKALEVSMAKDDSLKAMEDYFANKRRDSEFALGESD